MRRIDYIRENIVDCFGDDEKAAMARENLERLVEKLDGCGFTNPEIDFGASDENSLVITGSFHKMDDAGYYDGYAGFRIEVQPMFFGDFHLLEEYGNADDSLRDYIGEEIWRFLDNDMSGREVASPRPAGLELYNTLFARKNCAESGNSEWFDKHGAVIAKILKSMENSHLKELRAELRGKREMVFSGDWDGEFFTATAAPDFRNGVKLAINGGDPEKIRESLMASLSRDPREKAAKRQTSGPAR